MSATTALAKRSVSFDTVHVHEHVVVLGDNPSVSSGLPIALGGKCSTDIMDVDEYEEYERRGSSGTARLLSKADRAKLIRGAHSFMAILKAKREIKRIQRSREESYHEHLMTTGTKEEALVLVKAS